MFYVQLTTSYGPSASDALYGPYESVSIRGPVIRADERFNVASYDSQKNGWSRGARLDEAVFSVVNILTAPPVMVAKKGY